MKVLTVREPFASRILAGSKNEELRGWATRHRGLLLIHAARPASAVLGVVEVTDCLPDVYAGFAWQLARPRRFASPVPCRGRLGLWDLPAGLELDVLRQMTAAVR